jgi:hypothetical protein
MVVILKLLNVFLLATVKYFFSFPYALIIGLTYEQAIVSVMIGGIAGFFFFYYLSELMISGFRQYKWVLCKIVPEFVKMKYQKLCEVRKKSSEQFRFTKKNRWLVNLKIKYGFWGIIIGSPVILSIPVGAFLLKRYYSGTKNVFGYMMISIVGWAAFFAVVTIIFPGLI